MGKLDKVNKSIFFFVMFLNICLLSQAQKQANIWYFGNKAGVDFNTSPPSALINSSMFTMEGCAVANNKNGELLFYTNGEQVWDKLHNVMPNGSGLLGYYSSAQSSVIVPNPCDTNIFYIFTADGKSSDLAGRSNFPNDSVFCYSIVDMSQNGGLGDITTKNIKLFSPVNETVAAIRHGNDHDYWVVSAKYNSNDYYAYKITKDGISDTVVSTIPFADSSVFRESYLKFSPNGKRLAHGERFADRRIVLLDFNDTTGIVSNPIALDAFYGAYSISFSPDSKLLYSTWLNTLFQYNVSLANAASIIASKITIGSGTDQTGSHQIKTMQIGTNGKIYIISQDKDSMDIINFPNTIGLGCNYTHNALYLNGKTSRWSLPNFIESYFDPNYENSDYTCDSIVIIKIDTLSGKYIPNSFTPNGDGINDVFLPKMSEGTFLQLNIYDRWGELLFESKDPYLGWSGEYQNRSVPSGVYAFQWIYDLDHNNYTRFGNVMLIR